MRVPEPTVKRLSKILTSLELLEQEGKEFITSAELHRVMGFTPHTIRKDFAYLEKPCGSGSGYEIVVLKKEISKLLGLDRGSRACVVGLGRLGSSLLEYQGFGSGAFEIVAGFDRSVNKIEMMDSKVKLFPVYQLKDIIQREKIDIGIITVPADSAKNIADTMIEAGVKGILNFAPARIVAPEGVVVQNFYTVDYMRFIAAMINQKS